MVRDAVYMVGNQLKCRTLTLKELHSKMSELAGDDRVYCLKRLKQKLQERYGNNLYFAEIEGKSNVVCFQNMIDYYLNDLWKKKTKG